MNDYLWKVFHRSIQELDIHTHRYLYDRIDFDQRLLGLIGARGVGKTTLLLQYIKENLYDDGDVFYFSADNVYFNQISLVEFVDELYEQKGIRRLFIDEIHRYANWNQELKNIYDSYPDMKLSFSGSSSTDLIQGSYDLSRRARLVHMVGLSFREYINMVTGSHYPTISFDDLIQHHTTIAGELTSIDGLLQHFADYKSGGYYPFILQNDREIYSALENIIDKTIHQDITNFYALKTTNLKYLRRIINFLATIPPGTINTSNIAKHLGIDYKTVDHYLEILSRTGLARKLYPVGHGNQLLTKPSKFYLDNATLLGAVNVMLSAELNIGTQRELFFLQSLEGAGLTAFYPKQGDFSVNGMVFEVGGKNKTAKQVSHLAPDQRAVVKDDILFGSKGVIPLYLFGFLY